MEQLKVKQNSIKNTKHFKRIGDLFFFEGPLLTLFKEAVTDHLYLFDWADRDDSSNRWLVYRVPLKTLSNFIKGKISHLELFNNKLKSEDVFYVDIQSADIMPEYYEMMALQQVPATYFPSENHYFEEVDSRNFEKIKETVNGLSIKETA